MNRSERDLVESIRPDQIFVTEFNLLNRGLLIAKFAVTIGTKWGGIELWRCAYFKSSVKGQPNYVACPSFSDPEKRNPLKPYLHSGRFSKSLASVIQDEVKKQLLSALGEQEQEIAFKSRQQA